MPEQGFSVNTRIANGKNVRHIRRRSSMTDAMGSKGYAFFSFDSMAEAADVGARLLTAALLEGRDPLLAVGFSNRYALPATNDVRATFFVEDWRFRSCNLACGWFLVISHPTRPVR